MAQDATPSEPLVAANEIGQLELFELSLELSDIFENPFDPDEINVTATFIRPGGTTVSVPGFFMQPFAQTENGIEASAAGSWRVRFSPAVVGQWTYQVEARTANGTTTIDEGTFTVVPSDARGFIRVSPNKRYFAFQNGEPYFPIGQNLGWSWEEGGGLATYLQWLDDLQASGGNYARIYVDTAWFIGLDWVSPAGDYSDEQMAAWYMDTILETAQKYDIYLQVVLIWHQAFIQDPGLPVVPPADIPRPDTSTDFDSHSYNILNGGTMSEPAILFSDKNVENLLRRRLRYMTARWGYSPNIFAWELISDIDRLPNYNSERHSEFINNLARYVRELDPYPHLLTAGSSQALDEILQNDLFDFVGIRAYQQRPIEDAEDQVTTIVNRLNQSLFDTDKPILLTEFSLNRWFEPTQDDPNGIHLQNTIWASALSGTSGGGMSNWWATYIAPQNLYHFYTPLARFVEGINWNVLDLQPIEVGLVPARDIPYQPLRIDNFNRSFQGASPPDVLYRLSADGASPSTSNLSSYLYGENFNAKASRPQSFIITAPIDTTLTIGIRNISSGGTANLLISLDDQLYATLELTPGSENTILNIPLPAGEHRLLLDNTGEDWVELDYIEIADYRTALRSIALADRTAGVALVWLQNRDYTWQNQQTGIQGESLRYRMDIPNMPAGVYRVEFWDTVTGNILGQEMTTIAGEGHGNLSISLLPIQKQLAIRAFRIDGPDLITPLATSAPTRTPSILPTPTSTPTTPPTEIPTNTATPTNIATLTPTNTATLTPTNTASPSSTNSPTVTPSETATQIPSDTSTATNMPPSTKPATITATEISNTAAPTLIPRLTRTPRPNTSG